MATRLVSTGIVTARGIEFDHHILPRFSSQYTVYSCLREDTAFARSTSNLIIKNAFSACLDLRSEILHPSVDLFVSRKLAGKARKGGVYQKKTPCGTTKAILLDEQQSLLADRETSRRLELELELMQAASGTQLEPRILVPNLPHIHPPHSRQDNAAQQLNHGHSDPSSAGRVEEEEEESGTSLRVRQRQRREKKAVDTAVGGGRLRWTKVKKKRGPPEAPWSAEERQKKTEDLVRALAASIPAPTTTSSSSSSSSPSIIAASCSVPAVMEDLLAAYVGAVTRVELNAALKELGGARWRRLDLAQALYAWMSTRGAARRRRLKANAHTHTLMLGLLGRHGKVEEAEALFQSLLLQAGEEAEAEAEAGAEAEKGVRPGSVNLHVCNAMLALYCRQGKQERALALLDVMVRGSSRGGGAGAQQKGQGGGEGSRAGLGFGARGAGQEGEGRSGARRSALPLPDAVSFNTLISGAGVSASVAVGTLERMRGCHVAPDVWTYNAVLACLGREGQVDQLARVHADMLASRVAPDAVTWNTLIHAYARAGQLSKAEEAFHCALSSSQPPTAATFTAMLAAYARVGQYRGATAAFRAMVACGVGPDAGSFRALLEAVGRAGRLGEAEAVLRQMAAQGIEPCIATYTTLLQAYGRRGMFSEMARVFQEMQANGCSPDCHTFNILMDQYGQKGLSVQAANLFHEMKARGLQPSVVTFNTLIHAYVKAGQAVEASHTFDRMVEHGCVPDTVTKWLMVRTYTMLGLYHRAMELKKKLRKLRRREQDVQRREFSSLRMGAIDRGRVG